MSKHTPGPWQWDEPKNWHGIEARVFLSEPYGLVAQVPVVAWHPKSIGRANARLIAAAPQMLEALKDADATLCDCRYAIQAKGCNCDIHAAHKLLRAAIKLAEGDQ